MACSVTMVRLVIMVLSALVPASVREACSEARIMGSEACIMGSEARTEALDRDTDRMT